MTKARQSRCPIVQALTLLALAGCSPVSANLPFHFAETAAPLERGQLRVTAAGGGGLAGLDGGAGGGALRLRVGVGARQELGLEGELLGVDTGTHQRDSPPWVGKSLAYGLKLSWKGAPRDWFAVIAGTGAMRAATGEALGFDLALLFSRPNGVVRPYGGMRGTLATPLGRPSDDAGGLTAGLVLPGGLSLHCAENVDLFIEGGAMVMWATGLQSQPTAQAPSPIDSTALHSGGYGALGLAITIDPSRRR